VPNTALAEEAGTSFWGPGWEYLVDLAVPYALWLPLAVLLGWAALTGRALWRGGERRSALLVAVPMATAVVHALYVVRLGGDQMHARLLLPSVFALLLPVAVVAPARRSAAVLTALLVPWAIVCSTSLRAPAKPPEDPQKLQVNDQRRQYAEVWGYRHPVTLDSLLAVPESRPAIQRRQGLELARLAERRRAIVLSFTGPRNGAGERLRIPRPLSRATVRPNVPSEVVAWYGSIGRVGYAAGPNVRLVDANGLADPIGARTRLSARRPTRTGHEKHLPRDWVLARYAAPATAADAVRLERDPGVAAARRALRCPPLKQLVRATTAELDAGRFFANMGYALRERSLRFSRDPRLAVDEVCARN
jgi:arabinofuranosyltransferase